MLVFIYVIILFGGIDSGLEERHGASVTERVRRHIFGCDRRVSLGGCGCVFGDEVSNGVSAEAGPTSAGEQRIVGLPVVFSEPFSEDVGDGGRDRDSSLFAAFAVGDVDVSAWPVELNVGDGERCGFCDPEPGLGHEDEDCVVASPVPGAGVGGVEERFGFGSGEKRDGGPVGPFLWDGKDALDQLGVFGVLVGGVFVERSDRCEAGVAGAGAVVSFGFEVVEKPSDEGGVELADIEIRGAGVGVISGVGDEEPEGVPVGGDRVRTGGLLLDKPVREERFEGRSECGHESTPAAVSSRSAANPRSSGVASKYQYVDDGSLWPR